MPLSSILLAIVTMLGATAICVILFERLGFGSVLGFIVAGIAIGPHTPGPVASHNVALLQNVAEIGVVLFLFIVGLEMRPAKMWSMRRLLFGLGSLQVVGTAALIALYLFLFDDQPARVAIVLGFGLAFASTAIIVTILTERGELSTEHGQTSFAILMAQDLWVIPAMALVPILARTSANATSEGALEHGALILGVLAGIFVVGRYVLPAVLGYTARRRRLDAFAIVLFLAIFAAAWSVEHAGISMTLGAFVLGMLLSASDYRFQIEATVGPFKDILMGLFFLAVGMSIDIGALFEDWLTLFIHLPAVLFLKVAVIVGLALAFGVGRAAAIKSGFYLSQVGELAFVLFGAAAAAGLLPPSDFTLAMLAVAVSMILTPLMMKVGDWLADRLRTTRTTTEAAPANGLDRHVVIVGFGPAGRLIGMMLERAEIPYVAVDRTLDIVRQGKRAGRNLIFGNVYDTATQHAAAVAKAAGVVVTPRNTKLSKGIAVTLQRLYPNLDVYVRTTTLADQDELVAKGIKRAATDYIESTLIGGGALLRDLGIPADDVGTLVEAFKQDNYALIREGKQKIVMP